jgi:hypothetical protein
MNECSSTWEFMCMWLSDTHLITTIMKQWLKMMQHQGTNVVTMVIIVREDRVTRGRWKNHPRKMNN